jgi:hypothetical protein
VKKALQKWLKQNGENKKKEFEIDARLKAMIWESDSIERTLALEI